MSSMDTDEGQSKFAARGQASLISETALQTPKRKRGRPRKNKDLGTLVTRCDLPSGGALYPPPLQTAEEHTPYKSNPAASTYGSPSFTDSDHELLQFRSRSKTAGLPTIYPDPFSSSESPAEDQQCRQSPVVKRGRGRPPKIQALNKKSTNPIDLGNKQQQQEENRDGLRTPSISDREKETKRPRGRPKGSGKLKKEMPGASEPQAGNVRDAAPVAAQVLHINPGEDIARVVTSFCQKALRPMCLLSGTGAVGYIELKHQFPSRGGCTVYQAEYCGGGPVNVQWSKSSAILRISPNNLKLKAKVHSNGMKYLTSRGSAFRMVAQGIREILSVSGYFIPIDLGNERSWSSRFSVALADSGGAVIGGGVSGSMIAASKVQVVVGSFTSAESHTSQTSVQSVTQA